MSDKPTGRRRYRIQRRLFRKPILVLQVEVEGRVYVGGGDSALNRWWVDADIEHLITPWLEHRDNERRHHPS